MTDTAPTPEPRRGVSPSLDPANADSRFGAISKLPGGDRLHSTARSALAAMHTAAGELDEAIRAVAGRNASRQQTPRPDSVSVGEDGSVRVRSGDIGSSHRGDLRATSGRKLRAFSGREGALVDAARERFASVARKVDAALATFDDVETASASAIGRALVDPRASTPSGAIEAGEIRAFVRQLPGPRRLQFLTDRVAGGDLQTVSAILNGPAFTADVDDQTRGVIADRAAQKFAPESFQVREAARQAREMIKSAGASFAKSWTEALAPLGPGESEQRAAVDALAGKGAA